MILQDVLNRLRIPYDSSGRNKNRRGWLNCKCPKCGRWPYLGINEQYLNTTAWCCGRMSLSWALAQLSGQPESAVKTLIAEIRRPAAKPETWAKPTGELKLPYGLQNIEVGDFASAYLYGRNLSIQTIKLWNLRAIGMLGGKLAWRIFIPVHFRGEVASWTTRRVTNDEPRYWSASPGESRIPIDRLLYGIDYVRHAVVVCEGPFDAMRIGPGAVALLGTRVSPCQLEQLARIPVRAIALDNDAPGRTRARQIAELLSPLPGRTVIATCESAADWGAADPAEIQELRRRYLE